MRYHELVANAIKESGLSLSAISRKISDQFEIGIHKGYLSQLQNGKTGPASDELNRALGEVLSKYSDITYQDLRVAAYRAKMPDDVFEILVAEHLEQMEVGEGAEKVI